MVERLVANEKVEGSTPFARSKNNYDNLDCIIPKKWKYYIEIFSFKHIIIQMIGKFDFDQLLNIYQFPNIKVSKKIKHLKEDAKCELDSFNQNNFFDKKN